MLYPIYEEKKETKIEKEWIKLIYLNWKQLRANKGKICCRFD